MQARLMWADPNAQFTTIGRQLLAACGFDVTVVTDALACLRELDREPPDVLIVDDELLWGGADGLFDWLRKEAAVREIALVFTTGNDAPQAQSERFHLPAAHCLQKPYRLQALVEVVVQRTLWDEPAAAIEPPRALQAAGPVEA